MRLTTLTITAICAFTAVAVAANEAELEAEAVIEASQFVPPADEVVFNDQHHRNLQETCFQRWELWTPDGCSFESLKSLMDREQANWGCNHDSLTELGRIFNCDNEQEIRNYVWQMCRLALDDKESSDYAGFDDITMDNDVFVKEYFDGAFLCVSWRPGPAQLI